MDQGRMLKCQSFVRFLTQPKKPNASSPMDREDFNNKTKDLVRYSRKLDRLVLVPNTIPKACDYCPNEVIDQRIDCSAHRLGTTHAHFKHRCNICKQIVYDGSRANPKEVYSPIIYYRSQAKGERLSINGKPMGRPRKYELEPNRMKRPVGRPRKNPTK